MYIAPHAETCPLSRLLFTSIKPIFKADYLTDMVKWLIKYSIDRQVFHIYQTLLLPLPIIHSLHWMQFASEWPHKQINSEQLPRRICSQSPLLLHVYAHTHT